MTSVHVEEYLSLEKGCGELLEDDQIRFAGVINKMGNLVAGGLKEGVKLFQNNTKQQMLYMQIVLEISMRREFDSELGNVNYTASSQNNALMITVPNDDKIVLVWSDPGASTKRIVNKIHNVFCIPIRGDI